MIAAKALVLTGDGINCDRETAHALSLVGFEAVRMHISTVLSEPRLLREYHLLTLPGGFSFGDEIASGKVLAIKLKERLSDTLYDFIDQGRLILGICNGFQVLVQLGLLPYSEPGRPKVVSLMHNSQGRFVDRWVKLTVSPAVHCPIFHGITAIELPIRHGEGRLVIKSEQLNTALEAASEATVVKDLAPLRYDEDVNGSFDRIAALTNARGNVVGLMPHPEAFVRLSQHPQWLSRAWNEARQVQGRSNAQTANEMSDQSSHPWWQGKQQSATMTEDGRQADGLRIFENAARYVGVR